jgi:hypothetical protein
VKHYIAELLSGLFPGARPCFAGRQSSDERQDGGGEVIVAITHHHVPRIANIDVFRMPHKPEASLKYPDRSFAGCCSPPIALKTQIAADDENDDTDNSHGD